MAMKQRGDVKQIFNANWEPVCEFRLAVLPPGYSARAVFYAL